MEWLKEFASDDVGKTILTVAGTLLVTTFGVFVGGFKDIFVDWWKRRRSVKYNAMLLSTTIEQLVTDCLEVVWDDGYPMPDGQVHSTAKRPSEIVWPAALDWPSISSEIMYRCLLLPAEMKSAEGSIAFVVENIAGPPDYEEYFEEAQERYSLIGLGAVHILYRIRDDFRVQIQDRRDVNPFEIFSAKLDEIKKVRDERDARRARWNAELQAHRANAAQGGMPASLQIIIDQAAGEKANASKPM